MAAKQIRQLYVKHDGAKANESNTFGLYAMQIDRHEQKLLSGLIDKNQAKSIERELERHLGIEPERVKGESKG